MKRFDRLGRPSSRGRHMPSLGAKRARFGPESTPIRSAAGIPVARSLESRTKMKQPLRRILSNSESDARAWTVFQSAAAHASLALVPVEWGFEWGSLRAWPRAYAG